MSFCTARDRYDDGGFTGANMERHQPLTLRAQAELSTSAGTSAPCVCLRTMPRSQQASPNFTPQQYRCTTRALS